MAIIRIFLADVSYLVRVGLKSIAAGLPHFRIAGEAANREEALALLPSAMPDIIVFDYHAPGSFSVEDIRDFLKASPRARVLIISSYLRKDHVLAALELGAQGFIMKECDHEEILGAIHALSRNEKFFCGRVVDIVLEREAGQDCEAARLSERESEIVSLMGRGMKAQEIAEALSISIHTVYTHRKNIMRKLNVGSAAEVILYAVSTAQAS